MACSDAYCFDQLLRPITYSHVHRDRLSFYTAIEAGKAGGRRDDIRLVRRWSSTHQESSYFSFWRISCKAMALLGADRYSGALSTCESRVVLMMPWSFPSLTSTQNLVQFSISNIPTTVPIISRCSGYMES